MGAEAGMMGGPQFTGGGVTITDNTDGKLSGHFELTDWNDKPVSGSFAGLAIRPQHN